MQSNPNRAPVSPIAAVRRVGFTALHWPNRRPAPRKRAALRKYRVGK